VREDKSPGDQVLLFASNFFKHPKMLGSPIPSPRSLIEQLLKGVHWGSARVIVEYGPGVGTITREILLKMHPEATLVVIEMNREFVACLKENFKDPRLRVVEGSAVEVQSVLERLGFSQADYVISGIPFSTMPQSLREEIVRATHSVLQPRGAFLVYQYSRRILSSLEQIFGQVQRSFMLSRLLPVWFFFCWRL
jgi:phospholipid N-methyltransferase